MGLDYKTARLLAQLGVKGEYLCLGRPHWMSQNKDAKALCREFGWAETPEMFEGTYRDRFADPILKAMGCTRQFNLDAENHEGAYYLRDLNLPTGIDRQFDLVMDTGTVEHVFNIVQAATTCMELVKLGGYVVWTVPANNHCGHGFYQLSPEFFYRAFSRENGFLSRVTLMDYGPVYQEVQVPDPVTSKHRHQFISPWSQMLFGVAQKVDLVPRYFHGGWPQQSDYVQFWDRIKHESPETMGKLRPSCSRLEVFILTHFPRTGRFLQGLKFSGLNPAKRLKQL